MNKALEPFAVIPKFILFIRFSVKQTLEDITKSCLVKFFFLHKEFLQP